jgi:hypothetical protein
MANWVNGMVMTIYHNIPMISSTPSNNNQAHVDQWYGEK